SAQKTSEYLVFGTNDDPAHVPLGRSFDLVHWQRIGDAMPELPPWAAPDPTNSLTWAPAVVHRSHDYVMYITVPEEASGRGCLAALLLGQRLGRRRLRHGSGVLQQHRGTVPEDEVRPGVGECPRPGFARRTRDLRRCSRHPIGRVRHVEPAGAQWPLLLLPVARPRACQVLVAGGPRRRRRRTQAPRRNRAAP